MYAWHFLAADRKMSYGTRELVEQGKTYRVDGDIQICAHGLHASRAALDALVYAPGGIVCRVKMGGHIIEGADKLVAQERSVIWIADASEALRDFASWCYMSVGKVWDMPEDWETALVAWQPGIAAGAAAMAANKAAAKAVAKAAGMESAWMADWKWGRAGWKSAWNAARAKQNSKLEDMLYAIGPRDVEEN